MAQLSGNEFQNERGTQGSLFKWIWSKIYSYFNGVYNDAKAYTDAALGNVYTKTESDALLAPVTANVATLTSGLAAELVARANGDTVLQNGLNTLQAAIAGLKTITPWDATAAFPTVRTDGQPFGKGNYVQITVSNGAYKAGDMLICTTDAATTIAGFGDIDSNVDIATDAVYGTVKLVASLAEYNGVDASTGSKVITKSVLQAILSEVTAAITTAYVAADSALQASITTAYTTAISSALGNVYTKSEVNALLLPITTALANIYTKAQSDARFVSIYNYSARLRERLVIAKFTPQFITSSVYNAVTQKITFPGWSAYGLTLSQTGLAYVNIMHASLNGVSMRIFLTDGGVAFPPLSGTNTDGIFNFDSGILELNPDFGDLTGQPLDFVVLATKRDPTEPGMPFSN